MFLTFGSDWFGASKDEDMPVACCSLVGEIHGHDIQMSYGDTTCPINYVANYPAEPESYTNLSSPFIKEAQKLGKEVRSWPDSWHALGGCHSLVLIVQ